MKTIRILLTLAICLLFGHGKAFCTEASSKQVVVTLQTDEKPDKPELPVKGPRIPADQILCIIDFSNLLIEADGLPDIVSYELWDEDGECLIASFTDGHEMVMYLAGQTGVFYLRLVTENNAYMGYLAL